MRTRSLLASGTVVALAFAALIGVGIAMVGLYKAHQAGLPPASATFQLWPEEPQNVTVHDLTFVGVHTQEQDSFLEDHLTTALQKGSSSETDRLRIEQMRHSLDDLTHDPSLALFVRWEQHVVRISFTGVA